MTKAREEPPGLFIYGITISDTSWQSMYSPPFYKLLNLFGRDDWIRTSDLCVPNAALYQAEPRPDPNLDALTKNPLPVQLFHTVCFTPFFHTEPFPGRVPAARLLASLPGECMFFTCAGCSIFSDRTLVTRFRSVLIWGPGSVKMQSGPVESGDSRVSVFAFCGFG